MKDGRLRAGQSSHFDSRDPSGVESQLAAPRLTRLWFVRTLWPPSGCKESSKRGPPVRSFRKGDERGTSAIRNAKAGGRSARSRPSSFAARKWSLEDARACPICLPQPRSLPSYLSQLPSAASVVVVFHRHALPRPRHSRRLRCSPLAETRDGGAAAVEACSGSTPDCPSHAPSRGSGPPNCCRFRRSRRPKRRQVSAPQLLDASQ